MLCLGLKKSLSSPRLKIKAQGIAQCTNVQSQVWYHLAIQVPQLMYWVKSVKFFMTLVSVTTDHLSLQQNNNIAMIAGHNS